LIRSKLDYGAASTNDGVLDRLNSIHNAAIRLAVVAFRTSPITSLLCEASELSLETCRQTLVVGAFVHSESVPGLPLSIYSSSEYTKTDSKNLLHYRTKEILLSAGVGISSFLPSGSLPVLPPWSTFRVSVDFSMCELAKDLPNSVICGAFCELLGKYLDFAVIYTDGSKSRNHVGCAFTINNETRRIPLPSSFSVLSAELFAIKAALEAVNSSSNEQHNFLLCTDSLSALTTLGNPKKRYQNPIAKEIICNIQCQMKNIKFLWIPAHRNILGNELVDQAAKKAGTQFPINNISVPPSDFITHMKSRLLQKWQLNWYSTPSTNKLRQIKETTDIWQTSIRKSRREEVALCRLRIGHTRLTHSHIFKKEPPPYCHECNEQITVLHLLVDCSVYRHLRDQFCILRSVKDVLQNHEDCINRLFRYLQASDLFRMI